jgi:nucleotide-binding universal stress UspA family protein
MKTLLIPIDFSDTSGNVIRYATDFVKDVPVERIILLKSYYTSMAAQLLPSADFVQVDAQEISDERQKIESHVKFIAHKLLRKCSSSVRVESGISDLPLLRAIHEAIDAERPDLIMIGSDHSSREGHSPIGEQVIGISKTSTVPILIIPAGLHYQNIKQALVPCDFAAVSRLAILKGLQSSQQWLHPKLIVLNVDPGKINSTHEEENTEALKELLESYSYSVYYSKDKNVVHGILDFSEHNEVQLIIALPGHYSFFSNLTHKSITNALAVNANQPVLILK